MSIPRSLCFAGARRTVLAPERAGVLRLNQEGAGAPPRPASVIALMTSSRYPVPLVTRLFFELAIAAPVAEL
jgi:hypothetical protein